MSIIMACQEREDEEKQTMCAVVKVHVVTNFVLFAIFNTSFLPLPYKTMLNCRHKCKPKYTKSNV